MCGIAGYFAPGKNYLVELRGMTSRLAHRGPDAQGFFNDDTVGLGHRRLSIIDLSVSANQPMQSADGSSFICFNGEVFNFRELTKRLNISLRTHSDTEVMLELIAREGPGAVALFNGMFAIAFYKESEKTLFLFRDRLGVKPLYYYENNKELWYASELKALTSNPLIRPSLTLNESAISTYLQLGFIPEPSTIWKEIKKFPSGYFAEVSATGIRFINYWVPEKQISKEVLADERAALNQLSELLQSSVRYRMISDVPFGTFLSGGIDSSLVTCLAAQESPKPLKTFSIGFNESTHNEATFAKKIAEHLHTDHHEYYLQEKDAAEIVEEMMDLYDEPFADSSGIPTMLISKLARKEVKMVLTGDGADELFMGYGAYRWAHRLDQPILKSFRRPIAMLLPLLGGKYVRVARLFEYDDKVELPVHIFSQEQYFFSQYEVYEMRPNSAAFRILNIESVKRKLTPSELQALFDMKYYLKDDLMTKVDRASMHYSLECRTPFLDYRLVEFALNVSHSLKMKNGQLKILPKKLLSELMPRQLFERPKKGFSIPLHRWLLTDLKYLIERFLANDVIHRHHIISPETVHALKKDFFSGTGYLYNRIWNLIVLHRWLEKNR